MLAVSILACNALLGTAPAERQSADPSDPTDEPVDSSVAPEDAGPGDNDDPDANGSTVDAGRSCEPSPSDCLDPTRTDVIEVPTERTMSEAFNEAKPGQIIQFRKGSTGVSGGGYMKIPPFVTFRGCEGAQLRADSSIVFAGSAGVVEGFDIYGSIWANQTGSYVVRGVRCLAPSPDAGRRPEPCIEARAADALVGASVELTVERSFFSGRSEGIVAGTSYDTKTREVKLTAVNNVFRDVERPIVVSEAGAVGKITASISFNTFIGFDLGISLYSLSNMPTFRGNLFAGGKRAFYSDSPYVIEYSSTFGVAEPPSSPPVSGTLLELDPKLDDSALPSPSSLVVDAITTPAANDPTLDHRGCTRPHAGRTKSAAIDIGALER
ncbi:MAG TPA: hypothetical protein VM925_14520 [Labilithrix sp.]|nr:hypothetical protein [Labilithrix sp.]